MAISEYIEPCNRSIGEYLHGRLRDELSNGEIFYTLKKVQVVIETGAAATTRGGRTVRWAIGLRLRR